MPKDNQLTMFKEMVALYCTSHKEKTKTPHEQSTKAARQQPLSLKSLKKCNIYSLKLTKTLWPIHRQTMKQRELFLTCKEQSKQNKK
jgi:hypothetical protein